ncbi:hypothetical protein M4I32_09680 [Microbacterium sp. LRZ72]|uniref:AAA family ATPase n=1 Tax=Microbacterium sp. LRZ72 TaxID=2942481 RepID=UPI0029AE770D|nr:hypothetical protein [Microbacterium sp. LRZ72]MDX2377068.1 hypothetical protein [Microbacterium sp. LRZ72]
MSGVAIALGASDSAALAAELARRGVEVCALVDSGSLAATARGPKQADPLWNGLAGADVLLVPPERWVLCEAVVHECDRRGIRIVVCGGGGDGGATRLAAAFGLMHVPGTDPDAVAAAVRGAAVWDAAASRPSAAGRVIAVWGPEGAPGRSTLAMLAAFELARGGGRTALVDADSHAPSLALALGLPDEGPGFAAACRHAGRGTLDARELSRIAIPVDAPGGGVEVLCGVNRPERWPELRRDHVMGALSACRDWADHTVVDVAGPLERDEEAMSDLEGPRRNEATLAALRAADVVVAVCAADPLGVARFLRAHAELAGIAERTPVVAVANRLRPGGLGLDGRSQVRRALQRFAGVDDVWFVPEDRRATDAAMLRAHPVSRVAPRSPLVTGMRRLVGDALRSPVARQRMH